MPLSEVDRILLERCLGKKPFAWESFVDRFLGLIVHVVKMTAKRRMLRLTKHDEEDLVAEVFLAIIKGVKINFLREGEPSLIFDQNPQCPR